MKSLGLTATFYFPVVDNDGNTLVGEVREFENFLATHYQGYSYLGKALGFWLDDGDEKHEEEHHIIEVSHKHLSLPFIGALAREIKRSARQKAVYFKIDGKAYLV